jgi:hypothetical protein
MNNSDDGQINVFRAVFDSLYQVANTFTGIVGLTPVQFALGIGCIIALVLLWSFVQAARGQTKFSLEDE